MGGFGEGDGSINKQNGGKAGMLRPGDEPVKSNESIDFTILDVSDYDPPHVPSKTWRELIKKVGRLIP